MVTDGDVDAAERYYRNRARRGHTRDDRDGDRFGRCAGRECDPFCRYRVTVKAPSRWFTYALYVLTSSCVCTPESAGMDALTAL